jgi:hypothetical protein
LDKSPGDKGPVMSDGGLSVIAAPDRHDLVRHESRRDFFGNDDHFEPDLGIFRFFPYITFGDVLQGGALFDPDRKFSLPRRLFGRQQNSILILFSFKRAGILFRSSGSHQDEDKNQNGNEESVVCHFRPDR